MSVILETKRLKLREFTLTDVDVIYEMMRDPIVMQYFPATKSKEECKVWLKKTEDRYHKDGYAPWAVELKTSPKFLGYCGLIHQQIDNTDETEIGDMFKKENWGQGYATEAAMGCRDYGFRDLRKSYLISLIRPINKPSINVARRVGMHFWKEVQHFNYLHYVYKIDA